MTEEWIELLRARVAETSIAAAAREIGYSRPSISMALAGKYPAAVGKLRAAVIAAYTRCRCPFLAREISAAECRRFRQRAIPQSQPAELRHWAACKSCAIGARLAEAEATRRDNPC
jgi:hypothetical protein